MRLLRVEANLQAPPVVRSKRRSGIVPVGRQSPAAEEQPLAEQQRTQLEVEEGSQVPRGEAVERTTLPPLLIGLVLLTCNDEIATMKMCRLINLNISRDSVFPTTQV
jgi:hypothetical protein